MRRPKRKNVYFERRRDPADHATNYASATIEASPRSLGPDLLWRHSYLAHRCRSHVWGGASAVEGARGNYSSSLHGGDDGYRREFWANGHSVSIRWLCLHLRQSRVQPSHRLRVGLGD